MPGFEIPEAEIAKARLVRLRPGHWQRSGGAWSWMIRFDRDSRWPGATQWIGSQWGATDLAWLGAADVTCTWASYGLCLDPSNNGLARLNAREEARKAKKKAAFDQARRDWNATADQRAARQISAELTAFRQRLFK